MKSLASFFLLGSAVLLIPCATSAEVPADSGRVPTASFVVEQSIEYHDPRGLWGDARFRLDLRETRPDGTERRTRIQFHNALDSFEILTQRNEAEIEGLMAAGECIMTLNGSTKFSDAEREEYRLTCDRLGWLRDYYTYLWGLPMKLGDPGTLIDQDVTAGSYQKQEVWSVRVTYDDSVGSDTWYFYFDQQSYALVGYRFYHDEAKGDGEYIVLEGETEVSGLKIPTQRAWYVNADDRHLGNDILVDIEVQP